MTTAFEIRVWEGSRYGCEPNFTIEISDGELYYIAKFIRAVEKIAEAMEKKGEEDGKDKRD